MIQPKILISAALRSLILFLLFIKNATGNNMLISTIKTNPGAKVLTFSRNYKLLE